MKDEPDNIEDFTREYLRRIDKRLDAVDQRLDKLEQVTGRIDVRLKTIEALSSPVKQAPGFVA